LSLARLEEGTYHKRLFRGPNTNDMKKWDGPSLSWPTPHTIPFFLPPEDPFPVLLRHNSTPLREPDPTLARLPRLGQCNYVELIDTIFTDVEGVD